MYYGCAEWEPNAFFIKTRREDINVQRAVKKPDSKNKPDVKNPIDRDLHKRSTKVMEKIFENESDESLVE